VDGWMNEWLNEWMCDWMINWLNEWLNEWTVCAGVGTNDLHPIQQQQPWQQQQQWQQLPPLTLWQQQQWQQQQWQQQQRQQLPPLTQQQQQQPLPPLTQQQQLPRAVEPCCLYYTKNIAFLLSCKYWKLSQEKRGLLDSAWKMHIQTDC